MKTVTKQQLQKVKTGKMETEPSEPAFVVIPPDESSQTVSQKDEPEKNESSAA